MLMHTQDTSRDSLTENAMEPMGLLSKKIKYGYHVYDVEIQGLLESSRLAAGKNL